ncbi:hypothetical protein FQZ97_1057570 [compost metagenome]
MLDTTLEARRAAGQQWHPAQAVAAVQAAELGLAGATEAVRPLHLPVAQHMHGEVLRPGERREAEGVAADTPEHQGRLQGDGVEAAGRDADRPPLGIPGGDHGHAGGKVAEGLTQDFGFDHSCSLPRTPRHS